MEKIIKKNLAIIIIDMQDCFLNSTEKQEIIKNQVSIIRFCKKNDIYLSIVKFMHRGEITNRLKMELEGFSKEKISYFEKLDNDAFDNYNLELKLREKEIKTLLLMGVNAAYCVYATAKTAIKLGYSIITSEDLIAGYYGNDEPHCNGPEWYEQNGTYFKKHEEIIQSICQTSI